MNKLSFLLIMAFLLCLLSCKDCINCTAEKHIYKKNKLDTTISYGLSEYCNMDATDIRKIDSVKLFYPNDKDSTEFFDLLYKCYK